MNRTRFDTLRRTDFRGSRQSLREAWPGSVGDLERRGPWLNSHYTGMIRVPSNEMPDRPIHHRWAMALSIAVLIAGSLIPPFTYGERRSRNQRHVPSLASTRFPANSGIRRLGRSFRLARKSTILGVTELVAFASTEGLCVELDHIPQRSRAGGCGFSPLSPRHSIKLGGQGYSSSPPSRGVTELFGQVPSSIRSVQIDFRQGTIWHRAPVLFGAVSPAITTKTREASTKWFATDVPGCLSSKQIRLQSFGPGRVSNGYAIALDQHAACESGEGYKVRGAVIYGALPSS
jgi:hypothetical protein